VPVCCADTLHPSVGELLLLPPRGTRSPLAAAKTAASCTEFELGKMSNCKHTTNTKNEIGNHASPQESFSLSTPRGKEGKGAQQHGTRVATREDASNGASGHQRTPHCTTPLPYTYTPAFPVTAHSQPACAASTSLSISVGRSALSAGPC
jgi:hypothetical protein